MKSENIEKIKAKIEFIKTLFLVFVAALFSLIGYLFLNFEHLKFIKFFGIVYAIMFLFIISVILLMSWIKEINKIKD